MSLQTSLTNYALSGSLEWSEVVHLLDVEARDIQKALDVYERDLTLGIIPKRYWPPQAPTEAMRVD